MRRYTADGVHGRVADEDIVIRALNAMRVITGQPERCTGLPPAVLRVDHTRVELWFETRPGPYAAMRRGDHHPVPRLNTALGCRRRMEFYLRVGHEAPQAGQGAMLTMAKLRQLGAGQDERVLRR